MAQGIHRIRQHTFELELQISVVSHQTSHAHYLHRNLRRKYDNACVRASEKKTTNPAKMLTERYTRDVMHSTQMIVMVYVYVTIAIRPAVRVMRDILMEPLYFKYIYTYEDLKRTLNSDAQVKRQANIRRAEIEATKGRERKKKEPRIPLSVLWLRTTKPFSSLRSTIARRLLMHATSFKIHTVTDILHSRRSQNCTHIREQRAHTLRGVPCPCPRACARARVLYIKINNARSRECARSLRVRTNAACVRV